MGVTVTITWEGLDGAISHFSQLGEQALQNTEKNAQKLAKAGETAWKGATPHRTGRLAGGDAGEAEGLTITFMNDVRYYQWVDLPGHNTPAGWHTRHGYRPAKRRSHVAGKPITKTLVEFLESNIATYLSNVFDDE